MNKTTAIRAIAGWIILTANLISGQAQNIPIELFPKGVPSENVKQTHFNSHFHNINSERIDSLGEKVGGKTVVRLTDVTQPTLTLYPAPPIQNTGMAVIVCPGGGYDILAYDLEGTEICEWLNQQGITAGLLKYRVPQRNVEKKHEAPLQDLQRAIRYIRAQAEQLHIHPHQIGVIGFSAGAHLAAVASNASPSGSYPASDNLDQVSCKPDFCLLIYPAYLSDKIFQVAPEVTVTSNTPSTFLVQAQDDHSFINSSLFYYYALISNNIPTELHLYSDGGHGYGIRHTGHSVNEWPLRAASWLKHIQKK